MQKLAPRPPRGKIFGRMRGPILTRDQRARILYIARQMSRPTEARRHYGRITGKDVELLAAIIRYIHPSTGECFPSMETLARSAGCSRSHVHTGLRRLEAAGLISWVQCITRSKTRDPDGTYRKRITRTSNSYVVSAPPAPASPESKFKPRTPIKNLTQPQNAPLDPALVETLVKLGEAIARRGT